MVWFAGAAVNTGKPKMKQEKPVSEKNTGYFKKE